MKLRRLMARRLPGIPEPFEITFTDAPLQILFGPNGSGKSSLCRAVRRVLWPNSGQLDDHWVETLWTDTDPRERSWTGHLDGGVRWECEGHHAEPRLPPAGAGYHFPLTALLAAQERDRRFASDCLRRMAGGFDLPAWRAALTHPTRGAQRQAVENLRAARRQWKQLLDNQRALTEQAAVYARVQAEHAAAIASDVALRRIETALQCQERQVRLEGLESRGTHFPAALEYLSADRMERLDALDAHLAQMLDEHDAFSRQAQAAERQAVAAGLPVGEAPETQFQSLRLKLNRAMRDAEAAAADLRNRAGIESRLCALAERMGGAPPDPARAAWQPETLRNFDKARAHDRRAQHEVEARAERLRQTREAAIKHDPAALRQHLRAIGALRSWLEAPENDALSTTIRQTRPSAWNTLLEALAAVVGLLLIGAGLARFTPWQWPTVTIGALLASAALRALVERLAVRRGASPQGVNAARARIKAAWAALDTIDPPATWTPESVAERLSMLEIEQDRLKTAALAADSLADDAACHAAAERRHRETRARLWQTLTAMGLSTPQTETAADAEIDTAVERLKAWDELQQLHLATVARATAAQRQTDEALEAVRAALAELGFDREGDVEAIHATLDDLERRWRERDRRRETARQFREQAEHASAACQRLQQERCTLLATVGIDPDRADARDRLARLCAELDPYRQWRQECRALRDAIESDRQSLGEACHWLSHERDALIAEHNTLRQQAERRDDLTRQLQRIDDDVQRATQANAFETAAAAVRDAEIRLNRLADQAIAASIAEHLTDQVLETYAADVRPAVLERADGLLGRFTHGRYRLLVSETKDGSGTLRALDTLTQIGQPLDALSDATRLQLLVAARLAHALEQESGESPPLFFDDTLTTSDPERFAAMLDVILELARERQVFYLTSDPADVARIRRRCTEAGAPSPGLVNLALVRRLAAAAETSTLEPSVPPEAPPVPTPEPGESAAAYAQRLKPARPAIHRPWTSLDPCFVFEDRIDLVHRLRQAGIASLGQVQCLRATGGLDVLLTVADRRLLDDRLVIARTVHAVASVGRGRPVGRETLAASGAISDRYLEDLTALARECDGDARKLIQAFEARSDPRTQGFRARKLQQLEQALRDGGHLDDRAPQSAADALAAVLSDPARQALNDQNPPDTDALSALDTLTRRLWSLWT